MFLCNVIVDTNNVETSRTYHGIRFTYAPKIQYVSSSGTKTLDFSKFTVFEDTIGILSPSGADFPNIEVTTSKSKGDFCLRWVMMVKNDNYTITGNASYEQNPDKAEYYLFKNKLSTKKINIAKDAYTNVTISIAPEVIRRHDVLDTKNITYEWERVQAEGEVENNLFSDIYDANANKINKKPGYYDLDPNDSNVSIQNGGKKATVYLDKYDQAFARQPIYLYPFKYYKERERVRDGFLKYHYEVRGPEYTWDETQPSKSKGKAEKASCTVYINFQNLVDRIGATQATGCKLFDAKVQLSFTGEFSRAQLGGNKGYLKGDVKLQRRRKGSSTWENVTNYYSSDKINEEGETKFWQIGTNWDGFEVSIDAKKLDKYSLDKVNVDDELRLAVQLQYSSPTEKCYVYLQNANLNITYGLDLGLE